MNTGPCAFLAAGPRLLALAVLLLAAACALLRAEAMAVEGAKPLEDAAGANAVRVLYAQLEGPVTPAQADLLEGAVAAAEQRGDDLLLLRLDTPGGLVDSMRDMVKSMLNAPVPVLVWVGPSGAHAASAGVFLVAASSLAAMAPSTTIGAASPVDVQGQDVPETMARKIENDLMGLLRGVAGAKNRNLEWYEDSVTKAVSATAQEAVMQRVVEFVAVDPYDFLQQAGVRGVETRDGVLRFAEGDIVLAEHEPGLRYTFLAWLLHPQIAYLLLLGGMAGLFFEITSPGAVLPGVLGGLCLLMGLYALSVLPTNAAGVLLLLFALVLFLLELKITSMGLLTIAGVTSMFLGSLLLIKPGQGFSRLPLPMVAVTVGGVTALVGGCVYMVGRSLRNPPATGAEALAGASGVVKQWQGDSGLVYVQGALWNARSGTPLELYKGGRVRVSGRHGLTLEIEPLEPAEKDADTAADGGQGAKHEQE